MTEKYRIESELEIITFIQNLKYALNNGAKIQIQINRHVDEERAEIYTNKYTIAKLFQDENPVEAIKRELMSLTKEDYIKTVKDIRFPERSEMREFGKVYGGEDVYIKIRVELLSQYGITTTFVMSFHFAEKKFDDEIFPYRRKKGENGEL